MSLTVDSQLIVGRLEPRFGRLLILSVLFVVRTALLAIIGFMPTHGGGAIGSLDYPTEERKKLVKRFALHT